MVKVKVTKIKCHENDNFSTSLCQFLSVILFLQFDLYIENYVVFQAELVLSYGYIQAQCQYSLNINVFSLKYESLKMSRSQEAHNYHKMNKLSISS